MQLRNLVWATSKHDVYLISNYSVNHWSSLSGNLSEIINFAGHVAPAPTEVMQSLKQPYSSIKIEEWCYLRFFMLINARFMWNLHFF